MSRQETPQETVEQVRAREAARSRELAAAAPPAPGSWRPPLQPGEWRTLGLFAASGDDQLEEVLASMPLRVWRSDEVTPLQPHPNDPGQPPRPGATEFLTTFAITIPAGTQGQAAGDAGGGRGEPGQELAGQGYLLRLWKLPGSGRGCWACGGPGIWLRCRRSWRHCRLIPG